MLIIVIGIKHFDTLFSTVVNQNFAYSKALCLKLYSKENYNLF